MPKFIVKTNEMVEGVYSVDGENLDREDVERMFNLIEPRLPEEANQIDYQAYSLEVTEINEVQNEI